MNKALLGCLFAISWALPVGAAENNIEKWRSVTIDNDVFVGNDSGYSNGLFISTFEVNYSPSADLENDFWVTPLMWSMPKTSGKFSVNSYSFGQYLNTPSDIKIANPSLEELPYSALLAFSNSYIMITDQSADIATLQLGVVGPMALGKSVQKLVHGILGANEPQGWDTQINNEVVFEFNRGHSRRIFTTENDNLDILLNGQVSLGTIQSSAAIGTFFRYGENLIRSYPTTLLATTRISNPIAVDGWNVFTGIRVGYMLNNIALDGNTFRDSRSIDYKHTYVGFSAGFAYAWQNLAVTFAYNDLNLITPNDTPDVLAQLTQFGTISFSWPL